MSYEAAHCLSLHTERTYSQTCVKQPFLAFQTGGCLLLNESSTDCSRRSFLCYFHSAISNHLSKGFSMSPEWMVAQNRFKWTENHGCVALSKCFFVFKGFSANVMLTLDLGSKSHQKDF